MKRLNNYIRMFLLVVFIFTSCTALIAGGDELSQNQNSDRGSDAGSKPLHSLYSAIGYGNNMIYMGSDVSQDKPFCNAVITYGFRDEYFFSVSANHLSAFDQPLAFSAISLSYNHTFNKWLDISLGAARYQVNSELADTLFSNFFYGNLAVGADWKILYTNVSFGGILSGSSAAYLQVNNSHYFETGRFFKGKAYFTFEPYINLMFGTLTRTVTSEGTVIGVSSPIKHSKLTTGQHSSASVSEYFALMQSEYGMTAGINAGRFTFEIAPGYVLPAYSSTDVQYPKGFTLLMNLYFRIL